MPEWAMARAARHSRSGVSERLFSKSEQNVSEGCLRSSACAQAIIRRAIDGRVGVAIQERPEAIATCLALTTPPRALPARNEPCARQYPEIAPSRASQGCAAPWLDRRWRPQCRLVA